MTDNQKDFLADIKENASGIVELIGERIVELETMGRYTVEESLLRAIRTDVLDIKDCVKCISEEVPDVSKMVPSDEVIKKILNLTLDWTYSDTKPDVNGVDYIKEHWNDEND